MSSPPIPLAAPDPDAPLVALAKQGDGEAYTKLVTKYSGKIFRLAQNITQNDEDAEDILQEAFMKAYTHLDSFAGTSKFYTWIVRIAVNESLMKLRKRKSDKLVSLDEPVDTGEEEVVREIAVWEETPESKYSQEELRGILNSAVDELEPIYRTVFLLRDVEGLSTEETAEALTISVCPPSRAACCAPACNCARSQPACSSAREMSCLLTCKEFLTWLNEYLCDSTDPECKKHVEQHVNACPNCWVIFDTTKKTIQVYKGQNQEPAPVPPGIQSRLMAALQRKMATGAKPPSGGCGDPSRPN